MDPRMMSLIARSHTSVFSVEDLQKRAGRGDTLFFEGKIEEAEKTHREVLDNNPAQVNSVLTLTVILLQANKLNEALAVINAALRRADGAPASDKATFLHIQGQIQQDLKDDRTAKACFKEARGLLSLLSFIDPKMTALLFAQVMLANWVRLKTEDNTLAKQWLKEPLGAEISDAFIVNGQILVEEKELREAEKNYTRAINQGNANALFIRGTFLSSHNEKKRGLEDLRLAAEKYHHPDSCCQMFSCLSLPNEERYQWLKKAVEVGSPPAQFHLAVLLINTYQTKYSSFLRDYTSYYEKYLPSAFMKKARNDSHLRMCTEIDVIYLLRQSSNHGCPFLSPLLQAIENATDARAIEGKRSVFDKQQPSEKARAQDDKHEKKTLVEEKKQGKLNMGFLSRPDSSFQFHFLAQPRHEASDSNGIKLVDQLQHKTPPTQKIDLEKVSFYSPLDKDILDEKQRAVIDVENCRIHINEGFAADVMLLLKIMSYLAYENYSISAVEKELLKIAIQQIEITKLTSKEWDLICAACLHGQGEAFFVLLNEYGLHDIIFPPVGDYTPKQRSQHIRASQQRLRLIDENLAENKSPSPVVNKIYIYNLIMAQEVSQAEDCKAVHARYGIPCELNTDLVRRLSRAIDNKESVLEKIAKEDAAACADVSHLNRLRR